MRINLPLCILVAALFLCIPLSEPLAGTESGQHPFVVSGVVVNSGASKLFDSFVGYLSAESGYPMRPVFVDSYSELSILLRDHPDAVGWTCGAPFVEDNIKDGQQLVSIPLFNGKPFYHSLIMCPVGRPENSLAEFKGQVFVYSDPRSNSGFLSPSYRLEQQNIDIMKHFRVMVHAGNHERSIDALLNGLADVAAIDEYVWVEYSKAHPQVVNKLKVIERNGPYPFTPLVAGTGVPASVVGHLRDALRNMPRSSTGQHLLQSFGLDGFVEQPVGFYRPIQDMMNTMNWPLE